jgi:hypothetical protein
MKAEFVSVWDDGVEVRSSCDIDLNTREVINIFNSDVEDLDLDILQEQYVVVYINDFGGHLKLRALNISDFIDLWIAQECNLVDKDDREQLINEIKECEDFNILFPVISLWSTKDTMERVREFLVRNEACYFE